MMKAKHALLIFGIAAPSLHAASLRFVGMDMNTVAAAPSLVPQLVNSRHHVTTTFIDLVNLPHGAGNPFSQLTGSATATVGPSGATTSWAIDAPNDTLTLTLNHAISGSPAANNFAGSEGVFYFFALTPGTLTVTWDYGNEEPSLDPSQPYKVSDRGRSALRVKRNAKGLGDDVGGDFTMVNRDGSFTFNTAVDPTDDLVALQFDLRIFEDPMPSSISGGFVTMSFTPIPEPSSALLGLGALGLLLRRRR